MRMPPPVSNEVIDGVFFPVFSAGWRLSEESFIKNVNNFF